MSHLQLSSSTFFQGGHKILRHPSEFLLLHPDVGSVFAEAGTEGDPQLRDLLLHQLELFKFFPREFKAVPLPSLQGLLQISEEIQTLANAKNLPCGLHVHMLRLLKLAEAKNPFKRVLSQTHINVHLCRSYRITFSYQ